MTGVRRIPPTAPAWSATGAGIPSWVIGASAALGVLSSALGFTAASNVSPHGHPDSQFDMEWTTEPVGAEGNWHRKARTVAPFVGSEAQKQDGDVRLNPGLYQTQVLITLVDGQVVPSKSSLLLVR